MIDLPDLKAYRSSYEVKGVIYPLTPVKPGKAGFLNELPVPQKQLKGWPWTEQVAPEVYDKNFDWPKLTIVTPSYNQAKFIEQTIRSVLLQNYPNLEYMIIDGGSTDGSTEIIEKYAPWISYWESEKDRGQGHAINKGFSLASGRYYSWVNSDDYYLEKTFFKVITKFIKGRAEFVYGYAYNYLTDQQRFELVTMLPLKDYFIRLPTLAQPSCFWSKNIHQPIWENLTCALDYELWLRIVKGNKKGLIKEPLSVANVHTDAKTSDPRMKEKWHEDHLRICAPDAHGDVPDWNTIVFLNRIRNRLYKIFSFT
jgi:glycosyltransferase involved in cell wall biosynthesis